MSWRGKLMVPDLGSSCAVNWLISVVLPAPFGTMIACNSPLATSSERLSVATIPPNRRTRFSTRSKGSGTTQPPEQPDDAAAPEQHDQQQKRTHNERPIFRYLRQNLFQHEINDRADHRAEQRAHPAANDHDHQIAGAGPVHHGGRGGLPRVGERCRPHPPHYRPGEEANKAGAADGQPRHLPAELALT